MITIQEWKAMNGKERTLWLEYNSPVCKFSATRRGLVHGVGINDATYSSQPTINGSRVRCPAYVSWASMLERVYCPKSLAKYPTYLETVVGKDWHSFMKFRAWWIEHQVDGWHLDKDIIGDGSIYSQDTCIFIPSRINGFIGDSGAIRGKFPIGVSFHKKSGMFQACCNNLAAKKYESLGLFNDPHSAHLAWKRRKLEIATELRPSMDDIDIRIYPRVVEIINNAK